MARSAVYLVLTSAVLLVAVSYAADVTLPNGLEVAQVTEPTQSDSNQGDDPSVSRPDQTFTGSLNPGQSSDSYVGTLTAGDENGNPTAVIDTPTYPSGRKMMRKMLESDLQLSGNGVSAGDQNAGVQANAYGQGQLDQLDDSHIEPHGVQTSASLGGQEYTTNTGANPDCVGTLEGRTEGPCAEAGKK